MLRKQLGKKLKLLPKKVIQVPWRSKALHKAAIKAGYQEIEVQSTRGSTAVVPYDPPKARIKAGVYKPVETASRSFRRAVEAELEKELEGLDFYDATEHRRPSLLTAFYQSGKLHVYPSMEPPTKEVHEGPDFARTEDVSGFVLVKEPTLLSLTHVKY